MSFTVVVQALGWISIAWLVAVHGLIEHGRLPREGRAYRIAGCAAAASVVTASVIEELWPVAVLGLLWLRIEVFGHRYHARDARNEPQKQDTSRARMPGLLVGALAPGAKRPPGAQRLSKDPRPHHPHLPHPHLGRQTVDRVFKVEMGIVIIIAVVLFGIWAEQQRATFTRDTNHVICNWIEGC